MGTDVRFLEYPAYGHYVDPATGGAMFWRSPPAPRWRPVSISPYPLNVVESEPDFPMPLVPEHPPWFDPVPELIIPDKPMPVAPPPSPEVVKLSSTITLICGLTR
ncbi:hypothetical protein PIB30_063904 [Stylosanthes scabra]|uniref:Uncharacterized protein n=1 Tax=Stylosanthes scabra TaxID=79078 RepID=A0ABU6RMQ4_9FABA|nr:hypothetical protein [Stylosanthes scabra]